MKRIAVLLTCFNRKVKTVTCLRSLEQSLISSSKKFEIEIFLTDDGCTDGTSEAIRDLNINWPLHIYKSDGNLYWNGGMICAWKAALKVGGFDGYLWLNDDSIVLKDFWEDLSIADTISMEKYGRRGIYVGSTYDVETGNFSYGGFNFIGNWILKDEFVKPNNHDFRPCQCAHGNITYISHDVVKSAGIFYGGYIHGVGDHDYTYRAFKMGFPILVMPHYAGTCENDHIKSKPVMLDMTLKERWKYVHSPLGFNLHNTLLFQRRNFPYRYPLVWIMGYAKILFPKLSFYIYSSLRK